MTLSYPLYRVHDGRRVYVGSVNGTNINYSKGPAQFTGPEFNHILRYIKEVMGFHVYANSHFGGIHLTAHGPNSWHYVKDGRGYSLGADIGTYGDVNERNRIIRELIPFLDRHGIAWVYARDGHMANHYNHIHIDVGIYGNKGGTASNWYGYFVARRRVGNVYTAMPLRSAIKKRKPRSVSTYHANTPELTKIVQRIAKVHVDGIYGAGTRSGVKALQKRLGVTADGIFGPGTARAYLASVNTVRRRGNTGHSVRLIQYAAGVTTDGIFGAGTEQAVKEMQAWAGISADGIFGKDSRNKLLI